MELPFLIFIVFKYVNIEWSYFKNAVKHSDAGELTANKDVTLKLLKAKAFKNSCTILCCNPSDINLNTLTKQSTFKGL